MENSFQTSFIPKKPIVENGAGSVPIKSTISLTMVATLLIFIISCVAAGGLYFYKSYLQKTKDDLSAKLVNIKGSFDQNTISLLESYDKQSTVSEQVLSNHIILSPLFEALNSFTLSSIQYTKFEYKEVNSIPSVRLSGIASDYKSIALQANVLNSNKPDMFKDLVFSNLTKDKSNFVTFDMEFSIEPSLLSYTNNSSSDKSSTENTATDKIEDSASAGAPVDMGNIVVPLPTTKETQQ